MIDSPDNPLKTELGVSDLVVALGWVMALETAHNDLAKYWHLKLKLLEEAFDLPPDWPRGNGGIVIKRLARATRRPGIFSGILEYTPSNDKEVRLLKSHQFRLAKAENILRARALSAAVDILVNSHPDLKERTIPIANLIKQGLPADEPDPADFW